jgi:hypothetical protein
MKTMNLLLAVVVSVGLIFGINAQAGEYKGRGIDLKTLPAGFVSPFLFFPERGRDSLCGRSSQGGSTSMQSCLIAKPISIDGR